MEGLTRKPKPSKEDIAYTRYGDKQLDVDPADFERSKHILQFPRGQPYRRINPVELFKVQKPADHLESLRKSKNFIAAKFFGPFDVKDQALRKLLVDDKAKYANVESP